MSTGQQPDYSEFCPLTWSHIATLATFVRATAHQLCAHFRQLSIVHRTTSPLPPNDDSITHIPLEWDVNLDTMTATLNQNAEASLMGRCSRCWGNLLARLDDSGSWTRIKCCVCGITYEGEMAGDEYKKVLRQTAINLGNMQWFGRTPEYGNSAFVQKIFPAVNRLSGAGFTELVDVKLSEKRKPKRLNRHDFPPGSAGFLFIQANILMAGLAELSYPDEMSVADFPNIRPKDDGSLGATLSLEGLKNDPDRSGARLRNRMGTTMIEAMTAAFACELAMKAICLTCTHEAPKTHDLNELYDGLPSPSKRRLAADCPEIVETLNAARQTFGKWRYFEVNVGEQGIQAMIDVPRAHALGKAARVILDEALMVGLGASVHMKATDNVRVVGETECHHYTVKVDVSAQENPPKCDEHKPSDISGPITDVQEAQ